MSKAKLNRPNRLTLARLIMVPFCIAAVLLPVTLVPAWLSRLIAAMLFVAASVTDCLDGKIARSRGLITDFGKLLDPLADKFMVIGTMMAILYRYDNVSSWLFWAVLAIVFRALGVTSIRLVTAGRGVVIPASMLGKVKTVSQIVTVTALLVEPLILRLLPLGENAAEFIALQPLSLVSGIITTVRTVWSGVDYFMKLWKYVEPES